MQTIHTKTMVMVTCAILLAIVGVHLIISGSNVKTPPLSMPSEVSATTTPIVKPTAGGTAKPARSPAPETAPVPTVAGAGSLNNLVAFKEPLSCSVVTQSGVQRGGAAYAADGKFRINLTNGVSMIYDGSVLFAWRSGALTGLKLPAAVSASGSAIASYGGIDPVAALSYVCHPWTSDTSLFAPPESVTFSPSGT